MRALLTGQQSSAASFKVAYCWGGCSPGTEAIPGDSSRLVACSLIMLVFHTGYFAEATFQEEVLFELKWDIFLSNLGVLPNAPKS